MERNGLKFGTGAVSNIYIGYRSTFDLVVLNVILGHCIYFYRNGGKRYNYRSQIKNGVVFKPRGNSSIYMACLWYGRPFEGHSRI